MDNQTNRQIRQTVARLRRPNNPHRKVNVNYIVGGKISLLKSYYASCYADTEWTLSFEDFPKEKFLLKCMSIVGLLGYKRIIDMPRPDGCVIFDDIHNSERYEKVLR